MTGREEFVVDTSEIAREREVDVCRFALALVAQDATTFETDIPLGNAVRWPAAVKVAAERLARHATGRRGRDALYKQTGVVPAGDREDWDALVCFAPYAFDAAVWASDGELASLADEGTSLVMHLDADQRAQLEVFEPALRVVPAKAWRKRRAARTPRVD